MVIVSQARTVIGVMWVKGWTSGSICLATIVIKSILITFFIATPIIKKGIGLKIDEQVFNQTFIINSFFPSPLSFMKKG